MGDFVLFFTRAVVCARFRMIIQIFAAKHFAL